MKKKHLKIAGIIGAVCLAAYLVWYFSQQQEYPYTSDGITFYEDGSYSYISGPNIVTQHPDGLTTVTTNPDYVSDFTPTGNNYIPHVGGMTGGINGGIAIGG